jgi:hypothetical protein
MKQQLVAKNRSASGSDNQDKASKVIQCTSTKMGVEKRE